MTEQSQASVKNGQESSEAAIPLCIDLDGTLIKTDTLLELLLRFVRSRDRRIYRIPCWIIRGRAYFKKELARCVSLDPSLLPRHSLLIDYILHEKKKGRPVILVTAASKKTARIFADFFGFFDAVFASSSNHNLRGAAKLTCLLDQFGCQGFDYAGNDHSDIIIWQQCRRAILVNPAAGVAKKIIPFHDNHLILDDRPPVFHSTALLLDTGRWKRNIILFLPWALFGYGTDSPVAQVCLTYLTFSLAASSVSSGASLYYLDQDRDNPARYPLNPLASGNLPLHTGALVAPLFLILSGAIFMATQPVASLLYLAYLTGEVLTQINARTQNASGWIMAIPMYFLLLASGLQAARLSFSPFHLAVLFLLALAGGMIISWTGSKQCDKT